MGKSLVERERELEGQISSAQTELSEIREKKRQIAEREDVERGELLGRLIVATRESNPGRYNDLVRELEPSLRRAAHRRLFGYEPLKGSSGETGEPQ